MRFYESVYLSSYLSIGVLSNQELTTVVHSIVINFTDVVIVLQKLSSFYRSCHRFTEVVILSQKLSLISQKKDVIVSYRFTSSLVVFVLNLFGMDCL
jgi:hypothetical protein